MKMIKSILLCIFLSVITLGIICVCSLSFGTIKFLRALSKFEKKIFDLEYKLIEQTKALAQIEIDLTTNRQSLPCKRCSYSDIPASNSQL